MRPIIVLGLALLLAACEDRAVARKRNEDRLPPGCKIVDLDYGNLTAAVVCEGRRTTTSLEEWDTLIPIQTCDAQGVCITTFVQQHWANMTAQIEEERP